MTETSETFERTLTRQDQLCTRRQALRWMTEAEIDSRLGRRWQVIVPGVYGTFTGILTERQRQRAALLHAGDGSMLTDTSALALHRLPYLPSDAHIRVLVGADVQRTSRDFMVIRRTTRLPRAVVVDGLPIAPVVRALCDFAVRHDDERDALAVVVAAVQLGRVSLEHLVDEVRLGPARGRPRLCRIINGLQVGIRSAPEDDFRQLVRRSRILPEPLWNPLLRLPDGQLVSPDALFADSGLIHETNGLIAHGESAAFEEMQRRHDRLVTIGFTVLHNAPHRLRARGRAVIAEVEACHLRLAGRGLPPGVTLVRPGPPGTPYLEVPKAM